MTVRFPDDCERVRRAMAAHGVTVTLEQADEIWRQYSEEFYSAGFVGVPLDDDAIWHCVQAVVKVCGRCGAHSFDGATLGEGDSQP